MRKIKTRFPPALLEASRCKLQSEPTKGLKGQWLLLGALIVVSMISTIVLSSSTFSPELFNREIETAVFDNIQNEFDNAVDIITSASSNSTALEQNIKNYMDFVENYGISRSVTVQEYAIIGMPTSSGLNITAANYYSTTLSNFQVKVNGVNALTTDIQNRDIKTFAFADTSSLYNVSYSTTITDTDGTNETVSKSFMFDRRAFGILGAKASTSDYVRKELITS